MPKPSILIVDDEHDLLRLFARALELNGYDIQLADSAQAAMAVIAAHTPDAILLDLKMPYVNGVGLLYRLRETHPEIPVAVVTGLSDLDETTRREIRDLDAELRFKPLPIVELAALVRNLLARRSRQD
jgi:DNA-binding NtrC family response regulator